MPRKAPPPVNLGLHTADLAVIARHPGAIAYATEFNQIRSQLDRCREIALSPPRSHARIRIDDGLRPLSVGSDASAGAGSKSRHGRALPCETNQMGGSRAN